MQGITGEYGCFIAHIRFTLRIIIVEGISNRESRTSDYGKESAKYNSQTVIKSDTITVILVNGGDLPVKPFIISNQENLGPSWDQTLV